MRKLRPREKITCSNFLENKKQTESKSRANKANGFGRCDPRAAEVRAKRRGREDWEANASCHFLEAIKQHNWYCSRSGF